MKGRVVGLLMLAALGLVAIGVTGCHEALAAVDSGGSSAGASSAHADHADAAANPVPVVNVPHQVFDASTSSAPEGAIKEFHLTIQNKTIEIAPGVAYQAWTFNGTVPGPVLRARQGDQVKITVTNNGTMEHSIDLHAAQTAPNVNYKNIKPGESGTFTFTANYPGIFMYHCGTAPALAHIANGMYGAIIVDPAEGLPPAKEFVLVQSEFYTTQNKDGTFVYDGAKTLAKQPDYVVFNGYANQYQSNPLMANPGDRIRIWVLDAGPSEFSAFHVVGAIFDKAYPDGNPKNLENGRQTVTIPPGGGYMVEMTVPDAGLYPFVTHSFTDPGKGALGILNVGNVGGTMSH